MAKKEAGAGRGFVNPRRTDESEADYITPAKRYEMEKQVKEAKESAATDTTWLSNQLPDLDTFFRSFPLRST